ncbi:MAG: PQQ-dependent sugar dehydrogenase [Phycisphaeraceae bacterium]|nr:PQQ-dependent sugar dehydrogenase [Phycisphaeraceae bacterium]
MLPVFIAVVLCFFGNNPPATPIITEPAFDGRITNPEDTHMETGPFSDPDPGDTHTASDWEIWTISPSQRIWAALGVTGPERVHIHLGDGAFQNSHAGRVSLLPGTNYQLRVRHRDSSGNAATQWSPYATRFFTTGTLSTVFPMELDDIQPTPTPTWINPGGLNPVLPNGAILSLESADADPLLTIAGTPQGQNQVTDFPSLPQHVPVRVVITAAGDPIPLPETDLTFTDHTGVERTILLPAMNVPATQSAYFWVSSNGSTYYGLSSQTKPNFSSLARGNAVPWTARQPGFKVEIVATGFRLPVNIAFIPNPGPQPNAPLFYVTELYGTIKVVKRDGTVGTYAQGLLNYTPSGIFPGSGEQGLTGITVDPATGDVFAAMLYDPPGGGEDRHPRIVRFVSLDGGHTAASQTIILDMPGEIQGQSHQVSNLTIGPDGKLYIHNGDGFDASTAQNLDSYRGKLLRANLNGTAPPDNPFYNASNGINSRDYIYAYGLRNPFGGAWRAADGKHYEVENGPSIDRFAKVEAGRNFLWNGTDQSMTNFAIYNWNPSTGPVNIAFIQPSTFNGSQFPASKQGNAYITESGPTWGTGPAWIGKKITEWVLDASGGLVSGPVTLVEYNGPGKATVAGLAAGPDGLYFTDLYKDLNATGPTDTGANVLRIRFVGAAEFTANTTTGPAPLTVQFTDQSTVPSPTSWLWTFGDGATSTQQNPTHTYTQEGTYTVRLAVTGPAGTAVSQKANYIGVGNLAKVALIGGSMPPAPADEEVAHYLAQQGFLVTHFDDEPANRPTAAQLAASHDLIIVSSTVTSANIAGEFRTAAVPLIFWETALLSTTREALASGGAVASGQTQIDVVNTAHPITQGLSTGNLNVFSAGANMSVGTGTIAANATVLARRAGSTDVALMTAEQGASLLNGYIAPARRVFLFLEDASFLAATPEAGSLLKRAVCWAGNLAPSISAQPSPATTWDGLPTSFSVTASGAGPKTYQWRRNGTPLTNNGRITGATSATLTINPAQPSDTGQYDAVITAPCGTITTTAVQLTVHCYANCDGSTLAPVLTANDFACFLNRFAGGQPYANCDGSTVSPVLTANDFQCFLNKYAVGCN